jgi:nitrogen fixation protein FixH
MDGSGYNPVPSLPAQRSGWRFFPLAVVLCLLLVAIANGVLIYYAETTFPGEAISHQFTLANSYGRVLAAEKAQQALGWRLSASLDGRVPVVRIAGHDGSPLANLAVRAIAERPLGPEQRTRLSFNETTPGLYRADLALHEPGNWNLVVQARDAGGTVHEVLHLLVP